MCQSCAQHSPLRKIQQNKYGTPDDNFNQYHVDCSVELRFGTFYFSNPPPHKGNISALELAIVTKLGSIVKQREHALTMVYDIYNTPHFQTTPEIIPFPKYSKLLVVTLQQSNGCCW